jgi:SHS2 domain-containing protein
MSDQWLHEFEHTGDLGIEITAQSHVELFRRAAIAMAGVMVDTGRVVKRQSREIQVAGISDTDLMHDLLSTLLQIFIVDSFIWSEVAVEENPQGLRLRLWGETYDPGRHEFHTEIKGVTYHELAVTQQEDGNWKTRIIFDI